jgi:chitinase
MLLEAKSQGFTPNNFSIMPFDGGFNGAASQTSALRLPLHPDEHVRLGQRDRVRPRGLLGMNGRSDTGEYFPGRLPDRPELRHQPQHGPLHVLVGQPRPPVQPGRQRRYDVGDLLQRGAERVGLRQVLGAVRGRDPADEVSYGNHNWVAKWWTQNEVPGASQWGPWQDEGSC